MIGVRKSRVWFSAVGAVVALTALVLSIAGPAASITSAEAPQDSFEPVVFDNPERTIDVGLHIENIHQFSMKDKVYSVEGWYWLRWPQEIQDIITEKKIAPREYRRVLEPDRELVVHCGAGYQRDDEVVRESHATNCSNSPAASM